MSHDLESFRWIAEAQAGHIVSQNPKLRGHKYDIEQDLLTEIWKSLKTWREDGGASANTYVTTAVRRATQTILALHAGKYQLSEAGDEYITPYHSMQSHKPDPSRQAEIDEAMEALSSQIDMRDAQYLQRRAWLKGNRDQQAGTCIYGDNKHTARTRAKRRKKSIVDNTHPDHHA